MGVESSNGRIDQRPVTDNASRPPLVVGDFEDGAQRRAGLIDRHRTVFYLGAGS